MDSFRRQRTYAQPHRPLDGRRIAVCVGNGLLASAAVELVYALVREGAQVHVALASGARDFVGIRALQEASNNPIVTDTLNLEDQQLGWFDDLATTVDLIVVAPAPAMLVQYLTAPRRATPKARVPIVVVPGVDKDNGCKGMSETLRQSLWDADVWVGCSEESVQSHRKPARKPLRCEDLVEVAARFLGVQDCAGLHFVVSAGGTREKLDPVRFLGNRATGKMGFALAKAAVRRGARVTLVAGPTHLRPPWGVEYVSVESAEELCQAVQSASTNADVVVMAAAVADYRPNEVAAHKRKKEAWGDSPTLTLTRTTDVLGTLGRVRGTSRRPYLVGFAAETQDLAAFARKKLESKGCDLIVANDVGRLDIGFGATENEVLLIDHKEEILVPFSSKDSIAHAIVDRICEELYKPS